MATDTPETLTVIPEIVEELADIPEELTETCADSGPDATQESCHDNSDVAPHTAETAPESAVEQPAKKKPGRPAGSRNKGPPKPRAKRVVVSEAVEYAPPPRVEYAPPPSPERSQWNAQHQPIPTEPHNEMAALMLKLLSGQSMERQRRKDAQRKAWFS